MNRLPCLTGLVFPVRLKIELFKGGESDVEQGDTMMPEIYTQAERKFTYFAPSLPFSPSPLLLNTQRDSHTGFKGIVHPK